MKKHAIAILAVLSSFAWSAGAYAYDEDAHFYQTYAMARFAGIRHEVAAKMALSAQWMDESFISDPMSMMIALLDGVKKRRLLHFPSSRDGGASNLGTQQQLLGFNQTDAQHSMAEKFMSMAGGSVDVTSINFFTETREADPMATQLLMEGLKEGNLMKASASLHTLEDSFAHAGTPAESGHAVWWHWPDRPFASVPKFFRMVHAVFPAIVAIRTMLPENALDCSLRMNSHGKFSGGTPNCAQDGVTLADEYSDLKILKKVVSYNALHDPDYIHTALLDFYERSTKLPDLEYLHLSQDQFENLLASLDVKPGADCYEVLQQLLERLISDKLSGKANQINLDAILEDMNLRDPTTTVPLKQYIQSFGTGGSGGNGVKQKNSGAGGLDPEALRKFTTILARDMLRWHVPDTLDDTHRQELEDDGVIRTKEMEIRVRNVQQLIKGLFGTKVIFVKSNTTPKLGFGKEVRWEAAAEPDYMKQPGFKAEPDAVYVTFSLKEKNAWDHMIFKFLFPRSAEGTLENITDMVARIDRVGDEWDAYKKARKEINETNDGFFVKKAKLLALDARSLGGIHHFNKAILNAVEVLRPLTKDWIMDLLGTHLAPSQDNLYYQDPDLFNEYVRNRTVQPLLSPKDVWNEKDLGIPGHAPASVRKTLRWLPRRRRLSLNGHG